MSAILEDLTTLPPKRLEKRLEQLADGSLRCHGATVFDGNPESGLTVALVIEAHGRPDVQDLARVVLDDSAVAASCGWSLLAPNRRHPNPRLLLRVSFDRPAACEFTVSFEIVRHPDDPLRNALPLLLAADRFVFDLGRSGAGRPFVWLAAPVARECVVDALIQSRG